MVNSVLTDLLNATLLELIKDLLATQLSLLVQLFQEDIHLLGSLLGFLVLSELYLVFGFFLKLQNLISLFLQSLFAV
jgi:hypothetical protein